MASSESTPAGRASPPRLQEAGRLIQAGRFDDAEHLVRAHLREDRRSLDGLHHHALLELGRGDANSALGRFRKLVRKRPGDPAAHTNLGLALKLKGDLPGARGAFEAALRRQPAFTDARFNLAVTEQDLGEFETAKAGYEALLEQVPGHYKAAFNLGVIHKQTGAPAAAEAAFRRSVAIEPRLVDAWWNLAGCRPFEEQDASVEQALAGLLEQPGLSQPATATVLFTQAKLAADRGEHDAAMAVAGRANAIMARLAGFSAVAFDAVVDKIIADWPDASPGQRIADGQPRLIFIVGMPRSGTSLLEQMLAAHPAVQAGGERDEVSLLAERLPAVEALTPETVDAFRSAYFAAVPKQAGATVLTDRMPWNFLHLGLIRRLFPDAVIVHSRRDPRDVAISNYLQRYARGNEFSYDFGNIAAVYRAHERLLRHWQAAGAGAVLDCCYEHLVRDPSAVLKPVLAACGLDWDEARLAFHESSEPVRTNNWQVGPPLYAHAIGRWRHFQAHLPPVIMDLAGNAGTPA